MTNAYKNIMNMQQVQLVVMKEYGLLLLYS